MLVLDDDEMWKMVKKICGELYEDEEKPFPWYIVQEVRGGGSFENLHSSKVTKYEPE